jgi:hypothetical protein
MLCVGGERAREKVVGEGGESGRRKSVSSASPDKEESFGMIFPIFLDFDTFFKIFKLK